MNSSKKTRPRIFWIFALLVMAGSLAAEIRLPSILGSNMVLQQDQPVHVWGWAEPGESITVQLDGKTGRCQVNKQGQWEITLESQKADGLAHRITISGTESPSQMLENILFGEVWVCSGQSNMQWALNQTLAPLPEIQRANFPLIRLFNIPRRFSTQPEEDVDAVWAVCRPETATSFSAVAYYFGREIHEKLEVPVGLIHSSWGGTRIEPWTPESAFRGRPTIEPLIQNMKEQLLPYKEALKDAISGIEEWIKTTRLALQNGSELPLFPPLPIHPHQNNRTPTVLYNAMIHPLIRFPIRGAIWYQGEANRNDGLLYTDKMKALIEGWRSVWNVGDFPFYYVQLAPNNYGFIAANDPSDIPDFLRLPLIWEAQQNALAIPNTGMAVITDIGNLNDIHPRNKKDVGHRLALWALAKTYGHTNLVYSGPLYKSMTVEGNRIRIHFEQTGSGLKSLDNRPLTWFEIAGEGTDFFKAQARIDGSTVLVWNDRIKQPEAVRFAWHQLATPNLGNKEGLPAAPFRTGR